LAGKKENIIVDPGFGFAKNAQQNLKLLKNFGSLMNWVIQFYLAFHVNVYR
jgi:dihydropteroate synthase